jgi:hypothetical protein
MFNQYFIALIVDHLTTSRDIFCKNARIFEVTNIYHYHYVHPLYQQELTGVPMQAVHATIARARFAR